MQTIMWIGLNILLFLAMVVLVPLDKLKQLFVYGLVGGIVLAIVVFGLFSSTLHMWTTVGALQWNGIGLLAVTAWFFPTVIFGYFFPKREEIIYKIGYVMLFGLGSVGAQYIFKALEMWKSYNWNLLYTFLLAIVAHSLLAYYIMRTEQYLSE